MASAFVLLAAPALARRYELPPREFDFANRYFARGDYETAIAYYKEALESNPGGEWSPEALFLTARCLEELSRWDLAERTFHSVVETYPESAWADDGERECNDIGCPLRRAPA